MSTGEQFRHFIRRLAGDPELRGRMRADPSGTLEEQGLGAPREAEIRVVEDSAAVRHFVLPPDPNAALSDDRMAAVSGGTPQAGDSGLRPATTYSPAAEFLPPLRGPI